MNRYLVEYKGEYYVVRAASAIDAFYEFCWRRPKAIESYRITSYDAETSGKQRTTGITQDEIIIVTRIHK